MHTSGQAVYSGSTTEPVAPLVTVSHAAPLVAVQVQPVGAVTFTAPLPPPATMLSVVADSV